MISLRCLHEETFYYWLSKNTLKEESDQTVRMRRLIRIFSGRPCPGVRFLNLRLIALYFQCFDSGFCDCSVSADPITSTVPASLPTVSGSSTNGLDTTPGRCLIAPYVLDDTGMLIFDFNL